jgi:hypothetical protein
MSLSVGTRIGSYEITARIGAGGMDEVYGARDTSLGRDVAIKVLPEAFIHDGDRLARFEREARTLASLNHPNIAQIYVRPFPNTGDGQWQVSPAGGVEARWAHSGQELFYVAPNGALMAVPVMPGGGTWRSGAPVKLFDGGYYTAGPFAPRYDVTADGRRFLMIKEAGSDQGAMPPQLVIVQGWFEELKRLVPVN